MVGIVIVSHSKKASDGIVELALQMAGDKVDIISAGGMEDGSMGTDTLKIQQAIEDADSGEGVLILIDMGSGVLSAQTAVDLIAGGIDTEIADAPVLEGAVFAAVQAAMGGTLDEVKKAAEEVRKVSKLQ